jgi:hypothetical protein
MAGFLPNTVGYLDRRGFGKNKPFPISDNIAQLGIPHEGLFNYGVMSPTTADGLRGALRFTGWEPVDQDPYRIVRYMQLMYPELQHSTRRVNIESVIINPKGSAGPSFPKTTMQEALQEYPHLINRESFRTGDLILWKIAPKTEILSVEKLSMGTPRTFAFMDFHHKIRWTALTQEFNQYVQTLKFVRPPAGSISLVDDWHAFWTKIDEYRFKIMNDMRKFDAGYPGLMHRVMLMLRLWAFTPYVGDASREELKYFYESMIRPLCLLPNGQVVYFDNGQLSGQPSTTTDNSIVCSFLLDLAFSMMYHFKEGDKVGIELMTRALLNRHPKCSTHGIVKTGGDDSIQATHVDPIVYKECLVFVCSQFGFKVKDEEFKITEKTTECGFLGGRAEKVEGSFVYTPKDPVKIYDSVYLAKGKLETAEEFNKLTSLTALSWNTMYFGKIYEIYYKYSQFFQGLPNPLPKDRFREFWLGQETGPVGPGRYATQQSVQPPPGWQRRKTVSKLSFYSKPTDKFENILREAPQIKCTSSEAMKSKSARKNARRKAKRKNAKSVVVNIGSNAVAVRKPTSARRAARLGAKAKADSKRSSAAGAGRRNPYLCTLLDPEGCPGIRYPDAYARKTAMIKPFVNFDMFYNSWNSSATPPPFVPGGVLNGYENDGDFLLVQSPSILHPIYQYQDSILASAKTALHLSCAQQTDDIGLFPLQEDASTISDVADQMVIQTFPQNIKGQWYFDDQNTGLPGFTGFLPDGSSYSGFPWVTNSGGTSTVTASFMCSSPLLTGDSFTLQLVGNNGLFGATPLSSPIASGTFTTTAPGPQTITIPVTIPANTGGGRPGVGFRVLWTPSSGQSMSTAFITAFNATINNLNLHQNRFIPIDFKDALVYAQSIDQYRLVSMAMWVQYNGSDLQNGGQIAGIMYEGGNAPSENGLYEYTAVAATPGSYQQALKLGQYSIWEPSNENDMLFRKLNPQSRWTHPYIVSTGIVATSTQTNSLRARCNFNFEIVSTAQFYDYEPSPVRPELIEDATRRLVGVPTSMENPSHWETIQKIIDGAGSVVSTVGSAVKWAYPLFNTAYTLAKGMGGVMML